MVPTAAGAAFIRRAAAILNDVRKAREEIEQLGSGMGGRVVAGLSMVPHIALLPAALAPFRRRYPGVHLDIVEGYYPTLESGLRSGQVDFYIGPQPDTPMPPGLAQEMVFENTRVVLCRKGHPLQKASRLRELVDAEWATTTITMREEEEFRRLFESHGLAVPRLVLRSQSALTLIVAVGSSDILAMVPVQCARFPPMAEGLSCMSLRETLPAPGSC